MTTKIFYKTEKEIDLIRESSLLVGKVHGLMSENIKPGISLLQLDTMAENYIRDCGGIPAFKDFNGFPNTLCTSVNEAVVHGIPNDYMLQEGDIVSVDCGVLMNGYYGDSAFTYKVGKVDPKIEALLLATEESLNRGIAAAIDGNRVGDIGFAIQSYVEELGYSVVRELVGHGVGQNLHESPEVPNYGRRGNGVRLKEGMVIAIEPMINLGKRKIRQLKDGWTIVTADGKPSAHFEHTIAIRKEKAEILSTFANIKR